MATLTQFKARIASDLTRHDLTSQIANVVADTIKFHGRERHQYGAAVFIAASRPIGRS